METSQISNTKRTNLETTNNQDRTTKPHIVITRIVSVILHDVILHALLLDELFLCEPIDGLNGTPVEKLFGNDVDGVVDGGGPGAAVRSVAYVLREL